MAISVDTQTTTLYGVPANESEDVWKAVAPAAEDVKAASAARPPLAPSATAFLSVLLLALKQLGWRVGPGHLPVLLAKEY